MTDITSRREAARHTDGRFGAQPNSAPEVALEVPQTEPTPSQLARRAGRVRFAAALLRFDRQFAAERGVTHGSRALFRAVKDKYGLTPAEYVVLLRLNPQWREASQNAPTISLRGRPSHAEIQAHLYGLPIRKQPWYERPNPAVEEALFEAEVERQAYWRAEGRF